MAKIIHTMVRVHDLEKSLQFYMAALRLTTSHRLDFDDFSLVYLRNPENDVEIELTWNKGREPYTHGDGYGHIAVAVENLEAEHERMTGAGMHPTPVKGVQARPGHTGPLFLHSGPPTGTRSKCSNAQDTTSELRRRV